MRAIAGLVLAGVLLAGCEIPVRFAKPGSTEADLRRDGYECRRDASQAQFGLGLVAAREREDMAEECMAARGWTKAP